MAQLITCPACQYDNNMYQVECRQCGVPLEEKTVLMPDFIPTQFEMPARHSRMPGRNWPPHAVALFVTGQPTPILLSSQDTVVLGRSQSAETELRLDLSDFGAAALGVSRRHASIRFSDDDCLLEDVGSSNGTWVNGNRLTPYKPYPLQNGDVVRLGQLIVFVYFQEVPEVA